jgi:hypothetical protein
MSDSNLIPFLTHIHGRTTMAMNLKRNLNDLGFLLGAVVATTIMFPLVVLIRIVKGLEGKQQTKL